MRNRLFLAVCLLIVVNQLGFGIISPVMPAYARSFGLSAGAVGLVIGSYGLARFFANVPAGLLAERRGRRLVMILGTAVTSLASILIVTAANFPQLLLYRVIAGFGAATVITGAQIMVGDIATADNRGRLMSAYQGFFLIGVGLGPSVGGLLADGYGLHAPFVAYAIASTLACLVAIFVLRETKGTAAPASTRAFSADQQPQPVPAPASNGRILLSAPFLLVGALSFVATFARTGAQFVVLPLLATDRLGLSQWQIGSAMTVISLMNLATVYHTGVAADRFGRKAVIVPATVISGLSVALFIVADSFVWFVVAALVWGIGAGVSGPAPSAYVADLAPPEQRGRVFGAYRAASDSGYVVGPLLLGWLAGVTGYDAPLWLTAALFVVVGLLFARFAPELHQRRRPAKQAAETATP